MSVAPIPEVDAIQAILAAQGTCRERLLDDFMRAKATEFRSIAVRLCRTSSLDVRRHADEVVQIVAMECLVMVHEIIDAPSKFDYVTAWDGLLWARARLKVRAYADSAASGESLSGMTALHRRRREMARTRATLRAELDREPTNAEVVQATNEEMFRRRKDPARQSMLCSVDDLAPAGFVPLLEDDHDVPVEDPTDGDLAPHEGLDLVGRIMTAVRDHPVLAAVCDAWIGGVYDGKLGAPRDVNEIARIVKMPVSQVTQVLFELQMLAQRITVETFGIDRRTVDGTELHEEAS